MTWTTEYASAWSAPGTPPLPAQCNPWTSSLAFAALGMPPGCRSVGGGVRRWTQTQGSTSHGSHPALSAFSRTIPVISEQHSVHPGIGRGKNKGGIKIMVEMCE